MGFDQSECEQGPIYIIKLNKRLMRTFSKQPAGSRWQAREKKAGKRAEAMRICLGFAPDWWRTNHICNAIGSSDHGSTLINSVRALACKG